MLSSFTNFGFIVIATQYRGNDGGTGREEFGGADVQDVVHLIDIAGQLSFTNGDMYMLGISRGGLQTYCTLKAEALADKNRISAAVVMNGVSDLTQLYYDRDMTMKDTLIGLIGGGAEELPEEYEKRSAVCWPELIETPLLIIHGKEDVRAPVVQAEGIYEKLTALNKDVQMTLYDAGHQLPWESYMEAFEWLLAEKA